MQHNERGPAQQSPNPNTPSPMVERGEKGKEKSIVERMSATVLDIGRDILTANKMAKEKLDGKSPFMLAAQGVTTTLVGIGLEKAMDDYLKGVMSGNDPFVNRTPAKMSTAAKEILTNLESAHPRIHHFIVQSTKDLVVGGAYNGLAFFTRPLLESARSEDLVRSFAVNATEAMFTKGLDYPIKNKPLLDQKAELESLLKTNRESMIEATKLKTVESRDRGSNAFFEIGRLKKEISELDLPKDTRWEWQSLLRQYTTFSNPATLLGLDMLGKSMKALKDNYQEVRSVRKEKGIVGKRVEMTKKFEKREWNNRDQGGRWQGNKDKVYYGKSNWKSADQKAQEEYELKAAS